MTEWNWSELPEEYEQLLPGEAQRDVYKMLRQGFSWEKMAEKRGVGVRRIGSAVESIKLRIHRHRTHKGLEPGGTPYHIAHPEHVKEKLTVTEEHQLRLQVRALQKESKELREELAQNTSLLQLVEAVPQRQAKPLVIKTGKGKRPQVAATAFLSDTHFDEVVNKAEIGGVNEYNRAIATKRLHTFAEKTIMVARDLMAGFDVVHLDLPFGGDMVSGNIHEELARTNQAEIMDTVDYWSQQLASLVVTLSREFRTIYIPCVVGNHGRNTKKPRHKGRVRDNFDWLIYRAVLRNVLASGAKNVTFEISETTDVLWETMGHKYLLTHGDQASGGAGWGGIFSPIMRLYEKKLKAYASRGKAFDYLMMGHWHQFIDAGAVVVNGTLKGYDEFAHNFNFRAEPPQQAFWLTDPKHGKIFSGPLFVDDAAEQQAKASRKVAV